MLRILGVMFMPCICTVSNIQYVNLNTSMPIKEFTPMMYIFGEDGEHVMAKRRHILFFSQLYSVLGECRHVYKDYCSGSF